MHVRARDMKRGMQEKEKSSSKKKRTEECSGKEAAGKHRQRIHQHHLVCQISESKRRKSDEKKSEIEGMIGV